MATTQASSTLIAVGATGLDDPYVGITVSNLPMIGWTIVGEDIPSTTITGQGVPSLNTTLYTVAAAPTVAGSNLASWTGPSVTGVFIISVIVAQG